MKQVPPDHLYPLRIVEEDDEQQLVKVHYEGFSSRFDEWRAKNDIVEISTYESEVDNEEDPANIESEPDGPISPFNPYHELLVNIKSSLTSTRKKSTHVRVRMPFDKLLFDGGLKARGVNAGCGKYTIMQYSDLHDILGADWYFRGLNEHGDFCYVTLQSIRYYIYKRRPLIDYQPLQESQHVRSKKIHHPGYMLAFDFVRGDGIREDFCSGSNGFLPPEV